MGVDSSPERASTGRQIETAFGGTVDIVVGAVLALVGLVVGYAGTALNGELTRAEVLEVVNENDLQVADLSRTELVDMIVSVGQWVGIGLVAVGGLFVVGGFGVVLAHRRARRRGRSTPRWVLGVVGATVGTVLSFVPLSPILGGATASYLDPDRSRGGLGTGAVAGAVAALPTVILTVAAGVGLFEGLAQAEAMAILPLVGVIALATAAYFVGLHALGGVVGAWVRDYRD